MHLEEIALSLQRKKREHWAEELLFSHQNDWRSHQMLAQHQLDGRCLVSLMQSVCFPPQEDISNR